MLGTLAFINVVSFGNGNVMAALLQRAFVQDAQMLSNEQLLYAFAVARVTPGQINLYVGALGYMMFGFPGAVLSMVAIASPSFLVIPLLRGYQRVKDNQAVERFTRGVASAAVGLIAATAWEFGKSALTSPVAVVVFALGMALMLWGRLPMIASLLLVAAFGVVAVLLVQPPF